MVDTYWPWTGFWGKIWRKIWRERLGTQPDAADFNIAVTLVAPWEEYVIDLSPAFALKDGDEAFKHVIPDTGTLEEKILESWNGSAQANIDVGALWSKAPSEAAPAAPHDRAQGGTTRQARNRTGKVEEGGDAGPRASKQARGSGSGHATGKDPMLEYAAATALYQEVKLLNRYVADAALRRDYRAYVVRLQMSVVPFARQFPLDVYTNISFFPMLEPKPSSNERRHRARAEVIPLLVTDNLENTIKSRTVESLRNLAVTLSFLKPVRGLARLGRRRDDFKHALSADLNSLLTVGRVSDNTLQVRLGAERDTTCPHEYTILPRTHNITILLMVPREFAENMNSDLVPRITAVSKTQLRYARTGEELDRDGERGRRKRAQDILRNILMRHELDVDRVLQSVFRNDVDDFEKQLNRSEIEVAKEDKFSGWNALANSNADQWLLNGTKIAKRLNVPEIRQNEIAALWPNVARLEEWLIAEGRPAYLLDLWCDLAETLGKNEFAAVRFELPPSARLPADACVLAVDDGDKTVVRLQGGAGLNQNAVTATLVAETDEGEVPIAPYSDPPGKEIVILAGGHGMTITFPSLRALKIPIGGRPPRGSRAASWDTSPPTQGGRLRLRLAYAEGRKWSTSDGDYSPPVSDEAPCYPVYYRYVDRPIFKESDRESQPTDTRPARTRGATKKVAKKAAKKVAKKRAPTRRRI